MPWMDVSRESWSRQIFNGVKSFDEACKKITDNSLEARKYSHIVICSMYLELLCLEYLPGFH